MVAKVFKLNKQRLSSVKRLCAYLMDTQNDPHRVEAFQLSNCLEGYLEPGEEFTEEAVEDAANEMACVQRGCLNSQSRDLTYHFILSWRPGEEIDDEIIWKAVDEACHDLGADGLQRIAVIHGDTDSKHVHVCLNRVDPLSRKARNFRNDYAILSRTCQRLEQKLGFQIDNHQCHSMAVGTAANSMEYCGDLESFAGYCQRQCRDALLAAKSWKEFHEVCARHGIGYQMHGRGAAFSDNANHHCKASAVDRRLSLAVLEKRLGTFAAASQQEPVIVESQYARKPMDYGCAYNEELWKEYLQEKDSRYTSRKIADDEAWQSFQKELEEIFSPAAGDVLFNRFVKERSLRLIRRWLRQVERQKQLHTAEIRLNRKNAENRSKYVFPSWSQWIQDKATRGDMRALALMQARDNVRHSIAHTMTERNAIDAPPQRDAPCKVTRKGTRLYASGLREYKGKYLFPKKDDKNLLMQFIQWAGDSGIKLTSGSLDFISNVFDTVRNTDSPVEILSAGLTDMEDSLHHWDIAHGVDVNTPTKSLDMKQESGSGIPQNIMQGNQATIKSPSQFKGITM